ncbi:hypothetical protein ABZX95_12570 [Streptomyces sp. NPDC004232]|uniref:hypothetical protein n=1 Tax=Streptomyces sp. NPDC004232 TaxID=3154454 RepID=UPI001DCE787F|nr:hypothetical protein [Streptomyces sp. tea 10]
MPGWLVEATADAWGLDLEGKAAGSARPGAHVDRTRLRAGELRDQPLLQLRAHVLVLRLQIAGGEPTVDPDFEGVCR